MVYVKKITVDNYDEFLQMALNQKFTMAQDIVETVLENLNTNDVVTIPATIPITIPFMTILFKLS